MLSPAAPPARPVSSEYTGKTVLQRVPELDTAYAGATFSPVGMLNVVRFNPKGLKNLSWTNVP